VAAVLFACFVHLLQKNYPKEYKKREADKVHYRYPGVGGESYMDVMERLRPVIIG
jgi:6-phosphofructo-2-kinase